LLNLFSLLWLALGILDNVGVYSLLLKRRSSLNILLGGFSGGLPVLFGWSAVTAGPVGSLRLPVVPLLMAGLVFLWIRVHFWFLYKPTETNAWRMFKVTSPYLTLLFAVMIIDAALKH